MNYLEQMEKAVIFIENNLNEDIKVEEVAGIAGYSYYHFHRIFEAVLGETAGNYIRSRRIARAANDLLYTDKRILDIAVHYQFDSQESFNRAFKRVYKVSLGTYRKNRIDAIVGNQKELTAIHLKHLHEGVTIQPFIRQLDEVRLIGMRGKTTLSNNRLPEMWKSFNSRIEEIRNRVEGVKGYGVCEADPDFDISKFNQNTEFSHFFGVEVRSFDELPQGMESKTLHGGKYAVFTHKGKINTLQMTYDYIWGTWVLCSGFEIDQRDDFEFYDERFLGPDNDLSEFDIYIPVK
ncbi:HTH-type transcriptional activator RhaS [Sporomusa silvacetica DSM 10669]|uniref:HTH-type transcriptional activator RhaS n=1 Tax=Sporomusa silvacetica DSM 10669 TaxID=1123289 RepID=A0ABZ3IPW8_9FIRM|nr:AraC family transcriptional regulator [Sporomusa silvacetica]OZC19805.1 transposon Tn10 TetD protein [Sporomusa silvacetica DSM 10669]